MGNRYKSSIVFPESSATEPEFDPTRFVPTTWPGGRTPHVFLRDGSAISSHFVSSFSLVEFSDGTDRGAELLVEKARGQSIPVKHVKLVGEDHACKIWERRLVLVRPDDHIAWRGDSIHDGLTAEHRQCGSGSGICQCKLGKRYVSQAKQALYGHHRAEHTR